MHDKKLTDNEIKKALECCVKSTHFGECFENKCPLVSEKGCKVGKETLYPYLLAYINRLEAKCEELQGIIVKYNSNLAKQVAENERLKKGLFCKVVTLHDINTLKKEMVGE